MALFKKKSTQTSGRTASGGTTSTQPATSSRTAHVLKRPRITEKAANLTTMNVYTFDIQAGTTKHDVVRAVQALYRVTPRKVAVVTTKGKQVSLRTRRGHGVRGSVRKAYVYLKPGDKIDFA